MAVASEVGRNATVSTVGTPTSIDSTLNDNMVDNAAVEVKAFGLGVGSQVDEELTDGLDGLLGPPTEGGVLEVFALGMATNTTGEACVWDNLFLLSAVLKV